MCQSSLYSGAPRFGDFMIVMLQESKKALQETIAFIITISLISILFW